MLEWQARYGPKKSVLYMHDRRWPKFPGIVIREPVGFAAEKGGPYLVQFDESDSA